MYKLTWTKNGIPHGYLCETPIHLVYRVENCAPVGELRRLSAELKEQLTTVRALTDVAPERVQLILEEHLQTYDALLDAQDQSKYILAEVTAAQQVIQVWFNLQEMGAVVLYAICVMGNHVHVLLRGADGAPERPIGQAVRRHKSFSDKEIKRLCGRVDDVWDDGFYDRYVRVGTFWEVLRYILHNPVKAGLVSDWKLWPGVWVDERCLKKARVLGAAL